VEPFHSFLCFGHSRTVILQFSAHLFGFLESISFDSDFKHETQNRFVLKSHLSNKILPLAFSLLALSLFAKESINTIIFIAFIILLIVQLIVDHKKRTLYLTSLKNRYVIALVIYFILGLIGVLINPESKTGYLIRLAPFLLASFFIFHNHSSRGSFSIFVKTFILGNLLLLLFLDFMAVYDMIKDNSLFVELGDKKYYRFLYTRYTMSDYFSHIYLSAYTLLTLILVHQFNYLTKKAKWILTFYLLIHLFMMGSRAVVISLIVASLLFLVIASIMKAKYFKYLLSLVLGLFLLSSVAYIFKDTILFNRYSQVYEWYGKRDKVLERNYSINKRIKIYIIGSSFFKTKSVEINGTGIVDKQIEKRYNEKFKDSFNFKTETYNAHNQYIHIFIDWGYIGVLLLLFLLYLLIKDAASKRFLWIMFFWLFFAILLSMESFLIRQRGIMLFIIFGCLFISKDNPESTIKNEE
jgi:hypothetical protein